MEVAIKSLTIAFYKEEGMYQATVLYENENIATYCGRSLEEVTQRVPTDVKIKLVANELKLYKTRDNERVSSLIYR